METLIIDIPDGKSALVKQLLEELGVTVKSTVETDMTAYKKRIADLPVWTDEDLKPIEEARKAFDGFKPQQW